MLSTSSSYRSDAAGSVHAAGLGCLLYSPRDVSDLNCFIDAQPYDLQFSLSQPSTIDPRLLQSDPLPVLGVDASTYFSRCPDVLFDSSYSHGWPHAHGPYFGGYSMTEMEANQPGGETLHVPTADLARSCSPTSDFSAFSDSGSSLLDSLFGQSPCPSVSTAAGPSGPSTSTEPPLLALPPASGPIRRGRGRPRKDAPPVCQPPPLCEYVDPLTDQPCGKLLNRHHDLPRHMFKHCQDEAGLVISGRLPRERAILLPPNWKETDGMKLPCRFCDATFSRSDAVTRHEKREHKRRPRTG